MRTDVDFHTHHPDQTGNYQQLAQSATGFQREDFCMYVYVFEQIFIPGDLLSLQLLIPNKWLSQFKGGGAVGTKSVRP